MYYNKTIVTDSLSEVNDTISTDTFEITRLSNDSILTVFQNDISLTTNISVGILHFTIAVPDKFKDQTQGLLGNFNGNKSDDLKNISGFIFDATVEDEIYKFGENCELML